MTGTTTTIAETTSYAAISEEAAGGYQVGSRWWPAPSSWPLAEVARQTGVDLYSERFRTMFDAPLNLALPDGEAPGFNDKSGGNIRAAAFLYELAFARWRRPEYGRLAGQSGRNNLQALLYGAEKLPQGPVIPTASVLMKNAGYAMLRAKGNAVAIRFGKHGDGHGHPDKLNIVTYAGSKLFGLDPGSINYGVPLHGEWYRQTIAHNPIVCTSRARPGPWFTRLSVQGVIPSTVCR